MGGGVNPLEWILPPVAITHTIVDQGAKAGGTSIPAAPGSPDAQAQAQAQKLGEARDKQLADADAANTRAANDLAARTETPQEALEARGRALMASQTETGGKRRASQYLAGVS